MCCENTFKTILIVLSKKAVTSCGKSHRPLMRQQWQHMEIPRLLTKYAVKAQGKVHPMIFE